MFLRCRDLARNVERLDDPAVPLFHRCVARVHLSGCRQCSRFVKQYRATVLALKQLQSPPDTSGLSAFRAWRRRA
jgi:hypothetical protein